MATHHRHGIVCSPLASLRAAPRMDAPELHRNICVCDFPPGDPLATSLAPCFGDGGPRGERHRLAYGMGLLGSAPAHCRAANPTPLDATLGTPRLISQDAPDRDNTVRSA